MKRDLYIISGCNGAGKTTASYTVLPEILDCNEFVNADEIARGLSPFNPELHLEVKELIPQYMYQPHLTHYRTMSDKERKEFSEKLKYGLELAEKRMIEEKALRHEDVIVSIDGITFQRIPATQLLRK